VEQFEESDLAPALDAVSAFVSTSVAPLTSRPEAPAGKEELASITEAAARTGLLGEGAGLGLWEGVEGPAGIRFSLGALERVAGAGAGIAFHLHGLALGAHLGRKLGDEASQSTVVLLQGRNGFARGALAKLLSNDELEETEKALLSEFFPATGAMTSGGDQRAPVSKTTVRIFQLLMPLLTTSESRARLRMTEYRGKVSATMIYDQMPVYDIFRKLDDNTVFAVMDNKTIKDPFFFKLNRDRGF
jgi:hypothetical protein